MKKNIIRITILSTLVFPFVSLAQYTNNSVLGCTFASANGKLGDVFKYATCIISSSVIPLIFALAVAMFVWGVVQYVISPQEEAKRTKSKQFMLWGIIALAVMVSVWGLVRIVGTTFDIDYGIPQLKSTP